MNWYKQAQLEHNWKKIISVFGLTTVLGLASLWGLGLLEFKNLFSKNPEKVVQSLEQYNQSKQELIQNQPAEDIRSMIERHEGKRNKVYKDTEGVSTIGIGFNLTRPDAEEKLKNIGLNINDVLNGKELTDDQIYSLFNEDLITAENDARQFLPNFDEQPKLVQNILIDMAFNLGYPRLSNFIRFRQALLEKNYQKAADEMINSRWYNQVGNRSKELVSIMKGI